jgi:leader peptidase (prepilin peptidase)/N-methyltransferase
MPIVHTLWFTITVIVLWAIAGSWITVSESRVLGAPVPSLWIVVGEMLVLGFSGYVLDRDRGAIMGVLFITLGLSLWTDLRFRLIFNRLTYPSAGLLVALAFLHGGGLSAVAGAIVVAGPWALVWLITRGAHGLGDVKLSVSIGLAFGLPHAIGALLCIALLGGVVGGTFMVLGHRRLALPFCPILASGTLCALLFGDAIMHVVAQI